jgi:hypothetical protein
LSEAWLIKSDREKLKAVVVALDWVGSAILYQVIGLIAAPVMSGVLVYSFVSLLHGLQPAISLEWRSRLLTQTPGFPVQAVVGFLFGVWFGRFSPPSKRKLMVWVWVLPLILFISVLLIQPLNGSGMFGKFYPPEAHHKSTFLELMSWLILVIPSAAFALGAKVVRPRVRKAELLGNASKARG